MYLKLAYHVNYHTLFSVYERSTVSSIINSEIMQSQNNTINGQRIIRYSWRNMAGRSTDNEDDFNNFNNKYRSPLNTIICSCHLI